MISLNENIYCPKYLGVYISERIIPVLFDNAIWMGIENIGYDFLVNNNCKLDIKGSCICTDGKWHYLFRQNCIADYFMLFAFDNRIELNVLHIWMIGSNELSKHKKKFCELKGTAITNSEKVLKWYEKYELKDKLNVANRICKKLKNESFDNWFR